METIGYLIVFGAAAYALNLYEKSARARDLIFSVSGVVSGSVSLQPSLNVSLSVKNPTASDFFIRSFAGNVYINGNLSGYLSNFSPVSIAADSETGFVVNVQFLPAVVVSDIIAAMNGLSAFEVRMVGAADAGIQVPFDITYKLY